jgi:transcriptional regulator with XRE-family HTH domain
VGKSTTIVAGIEIIGCAGCRMVPAIDPGLAMLGRTLRKARRDLDLSQEALAQRAGMHANHVGAIERGTKDLRWTTLERIITALDMTPAELFTRYGDPGASHAPAD